jgi:hypothetical protein
MAAENRPQCAPLAHELNLTEAYWVELSVGWRIQVQRNVSRQNTGQSSLHSVAPTLHDLHPSSADELRLASYGRLRSRASHCPRAIHDQSALAHAVSCISLHLAQQSAAVLSLQEVCLRSYSISAANIPTGLLTTRPCSSVLGSQTAEAPRPCPWLFVTAHHWGSSWASFVNALGCSTPSPLPRVPWLTVDSSRGRDPTVIHLLSSLFSVLSYLLLVPFSQPSAS